MHKSLIKILKIYYARYKLLLTRESLLLSHIPCQIASNPGFVSGQSGSFNMSISDVLQNWFLNLVMGHKVKGSVSVVTYYIN